MSVWSVPINKWQAYTLRHTVIWKWKWECDARTAALPPPCTTLSSDNSNSHIAPVPCQNRRTLCVCWPCNMHYLCYSIAWCNNRLSSVVGGWDNCSMSASHGADTIWLTVTHTFITLNPSINARAYFSLTSWWKVLQKIFISDLLSLNIRLIAI